MKMICEVFIDAKQGIHLKTNSLDDSYSFFP